METIVAPRAAPSLATASRAFGVATQHGHLCLRSLTRRWSPTSAVADVSVTGGCGLRPARPEPRLPRRSASSDDEPSIRSQCLLRTWRPAGPLLDLDDDQRSSRSVFAVRRILHHERLEGAGERRRLFRAGGAVCANPPQLVPVVVVLIEQHTDGWVHLDIAQPLQRSCRLRLVIDGRDD